MYSQFKYRDKSFKLTTLSQLPPNVDLSNILETLNSNTNKVQSTRLELKKYDIMPNYEIGQCYTIGITLSLGNIVFWHAVLSASFALRLKQIRFSVIFISRATGRGRVSGRRCVQLPLNTQSRLRVLDTCNVLRGSPSKSDYRQPYLLFIQDTCHDIQV